MKDQDKHFKFIFNGKQSVIRLDEIRLVKETDRTEIYTYKDYRGKSVTLEVPKAYPGLKEEVLNTKKVEHTFPFPQNPEVKVSNNPLAVFLIAFLVMACVIIISILWR